MNKKENYQKFKVSNFTILLTIYQASLGCVHEFLGVNLMFTFRGDIV